MRLLLGHHRTTPAQDVALLLARVGLGIVMLAHGWQKLDQQGLTGTADGFAGMGIPLPEVAAAFSIAVEVGGGLLMILGAVTRPVALLFALNMLGALWFVHFDAGFWAQQGGFEYVLVLALFAAALGAVGAGRLSLDRLLLARGTAT